MAYQKKYFNQFTTLDNKVNLVEIWQDTEDVIEAAEVKSMSMPFGIELPDLDHKFQCVRGTGCEINFLSVTDGQFFSNLYSANKKEFLVKHYIDEALHWLGYLNTEMVREPYHLATNYEFQITGNDGFALMERYQFLDTDGTKYTGIKSKYDIIGIIFDRIGLPFTELRIALSTTTAAFTIGAQETLLHKSFVDCANFYDEDGVAMTMREVLEGILKPYGAIITQIEGNIYITDIHSLASDSLVYKCFLLTDWSYSQTITKEDNVKAISDIGHMGTGTEKEQSGGKNKQVVSYSPYPIKEIISDTLTKEDEFTTASVWGTKNGYQYKDLSGGTHWNDGSMGFFEESRKDANSEASVYLRFTRGASDYRVASITYHPYLVLPATSSPVAGQPGKYVYGTYLRLSGQILYRHGAEDVNPYTSTDTNQYAGWIVGQAKCKIGTKYWNGIEWTTTDSTFDFITADKNAHFVVNQWFNFGQNNGIIVPITEDLSGELSFEIWSFFGFRSIWSNTNYRECWMKDLTIELINSTGSELPDNDVEYTSYLNADFKEEAEKVNLICGTEVSVSDRAKILYLDTVYKPITEWTRASQSAKIEELLLNSLSSNYRAGYLSLNNMKLKNGFNHLNILTDTHTASRKFMVKSMRKNFYDNLVECNLVEITAEELTIVK